jgi:hypothetical protein
MNRKPKSLREKKASCQIKVKYVTLAADNGFGDFNDFIEYMLHNVSDLQITIDKLQTVNHALTQELHKLQSNIKNDDEKKNLSAK